MLKEFREVDDEAASLGAGLKPKCIYVCGTNAERGDELKPFDKRQAPPIRVWRYLVEHCGVDPKEIAAYCDLRVSSTHPLPDQFVLFRGGESDYAAFVEGGFRHVIFNLALQEGWDDPECYLAYIDKSMGSELQVEQVVGRVLRQPGARYYNSARLNGCGFYIHVDDDGVFRNILTDLQRRLMRDLPAIEVRSRGSSGARPKDILDPLYPESIPQPVLDTSGAVDGVQEILAGVAGYDGSAAARADGLVAEVVQRVGSDTPSDVEPEWKKSGDGLPVSARWIIRRAIDRRFPAARGVCDLEASRFGHPVHVGSPAAKALERVGEEVVRVVLENAELSTIPIEPYKVGPISVGDDRIVFKNALHEAYGDLNAQELECARALDTLGWRWCRNPSPGGYALPLLKSGGNQRFFPDFVVWTDRTIWLIDPKGDHLIRDAAAVKLIAPDHMPGQRPVRVCLITEGKWDAQFSVSPGGVTVWRLQAGRIVPTTYTSYSALVRKVIGTPSKQLAMTS
jgi:type III restriction enzyme